MKIPFLVNFIFVASFVTASNVYSGLDPQKRDEQQHAGTKEKIIFDIQADRNEVTIAVSLPISRENLRELIKSAVEEEALENPNLACFLNSEWLDNKTDSVYRSLTKLMLQN